MHGLLHPFTAAMIVFSSVALLPAADHGFPSASQTIQQSGTQAPDQVLPQTSPASSGNSLSLNWSDVEQNTWANAKTYVAFLLRMS
jgi:hypothetical protein